MCNGIDRPAASPALLARPRDAVRAGRGWAGAHSHAAMQPRQVMILAYFISSNLSRSLPGVAGQHWGGAGLPVRYDAPARLQRYPCNHFRRGKEEAGVRH